VDKLTTDFLYLHKKKYLTKWVDVLQLHGWRRRTSKVWYGGYWPQGPYILWQVRFKTLIFFFWWFVLKKNHVFESCVIFFVLKWVVFLFKDNQN